VAINANPNGLLMFERTVSLEIDEAYQDLKTTLVKKGCKIISEYPPMRIIVKQGSLWGMTPKTAKRNVDFSLKYTDSETKVMTSSSLSSDWKNITLIGCAFAAVLIGVCLWIAFDLSSFMIIQKPSFWSWLIAFNGSVDLQIGQFFVNMTKGFVVFLSVIILLEIVVIVYVHARIDWFAQEVLNSLSN
jgi:hypothetical protein